MIDIWLKNSNEGYPESGNLMKAFILLYIDLPSPTAATIVLKLSSAKTMSDASLATWRYITIKTQLVKYAPKNVLNLINIFASLLEKKFCPRNKKCSSWEDEWKLPKTKNLSIYWFLLIGLHNWFTRMQHR